MNNSASVYILSNMGNFPCRKFHQTSFS